MADANKSIESRIEWCRRQSTEACAPLESAGWRAETEGLQDGRLMLRAAAVLQQFPSVTRTATDNMGNVNMPGLTRHVKQIMGRVSSHRV